MNINTSLRFLAIAGAFLSAKSALAHNSFSVMQTLVAKDTLKTQFSDVSRLTNPVSAEVPQTISKDTSNSRQSAPVSSIAAIPSSPFDRQPQNDSLVDDRSNPVAEPQPQPEIAPTATDSNSGDRIIQSRFSSDAVRVLPTQTQVFSSDVASPGVNRQISSVPSQVEPPEFSITIPVPPPRTQFLKVQRVKPLSRFVKIQTTPFVKIQTTPFVKLKTTPVATMPTVTPQPDSKPVVTIPTLAPRTNIIPMVSVATATPKTVTAPISKPPAFISNSTNGSDSEIIYPLTRPAPITSRYGWRTHPLTGTRRFHSGVDIAAPTGTPVVATESGTVVSAGWNNGYGKAIVIQHGDSLQTLYGHLSEISVQAGQTIAQGTVIGQVGSTGNSTGPHLHFEKRVPEADGWVAADPSQEIQYAVDNLRRSMPFAQKDLPQGL